MARQIWYDLLKSFIGLNIYDIMYTYDNSEIHVGVKIVVVHLRFH